MGIVDAIAGPEAFLGCDLDPTIVQRRLFDLITPTLTVGARAIESYGCRLLVVDVLQSFEIHADKQGRSSQRVGTDCVPLSPQDHRRLREERLGVDWSGQRAERGRDEISPVALRAARDALERFPDERRPDDRVIAPVLQKGEAEAESILRHLAQEGAGMIEATRETGVLRKRKYRLRAEALKALGASAAGADQIS